MFWRIYVLFMLISWPVYAQFEVNFTPSLSCEQKIADLIDEAKNSIDVAVFSINNDNIVKVLKDAHR